MTVCGEKVTGVCVMGKCPHIKRCCPVVWDKYGKIKPMTNEEWFCGLSTEEKAKWLNQQLMYAAAAREQGYFTVDGLIKWLKEKHE